VAGPAERLVRQEYVGGVLLSETQCERGVDVDRDVARWRRGPHDLRAPAPALGIWCSSSDAVAFTPPAVEIERVSEQFRLRPERFEVAQAVTPSAMATAR